MDIQSKQKIPIIREKKLLKMYTTVIKNVYHPIFFENEIFSIGVIKNHGHPEA